MENRESLIARLTETGGRVRVRNALTPVVWLVGVVWAPCCVVLGLNPNPPLIVFVLPAVVVGVAVFGWLWLLFFDRDRLQSEEYLLRKQIVDIIEDKASRKAIDASLVPVISRDEFLQLPPAGPEDPK